VIDPPLAALGGCQFVPLPTDASFVSLLRRQLRTENRTKERGSLSMQSSKSGKPSCKRKVLLEAEISSITIHFILEIHVCTADFLGFFYFQTSALRLRPTYAEI
jgi:hypothetical protein